MVKTRTKYDRKKMAKQLKNRTQESHDRREDSGRFGSFFREDLEDVSFWSCGEGEHQIDIIPYIAGANNPKVEEGEFSYLLDIWVHQGVGVNEDQFVCPGRNYGDPCPICEHQRELRRADDFDEDLVKSLSPKRRVIYNIVCYDSDKEESKGIQVWNVAHWFMERYLTPLAKQPKSGGFVPFADPDDGKQICFERKGSGQTSTEYLGHKFLDRDYKISDELLDGACCLDELIHIPTYDELRDVYYGSFGTRDSEKTQEEEKPEVQEEPRKKESVEMDSCPAGGEFGIDTDRLDQCDPCDIWDDCARRADEIEEDKKKKREQRRLKRK